MSELYHDSESCLILISFRGATESKIYKNIWVNFAHASSTCFNPFATEFFGLVVRNYFWSQF